MNIELSLPAGSLEMAIAAFEGGADSVYLGMKDFSARKKAHNFSIEDLSKLKAIATKLNKKIYVTINTIIKDEELNDLALLLRELETLNIDGLIVQDFAVANLVKKYFPTIELHGSTQLAVHTINGVKFLQEQGFKRVVLARELNFEQIKEIRKSCPDVELKVFIHGAMCYGFSGLCEASRLLTNRSANRGECSQICRTWFSCKQTATDGYFFSLKDQMLGKDLLKLQEIGIDSVKIEGRMKGPEYASSCAKYYRAILDGQRNVDILEQNMKTTFSRSTKDGYFSNHDHMVCSDYPSHRGIEIGTIKKVLGSEALVELDHAIALRDGLLVINKDCTKESAKFSLSSIEDKFGKRKSFANQGEKVIINIPNRSNIQSSDKLYLIKMHNQNAQAIKTESLSLYKRPIDQSVEIYDNHITLNAKVYNNEVSFTYPIELQQANKESDFYQIIENLLLSSSDSSFTLKTLSLDTKNCSFSPIFAPISKLKELRRQWYEKLDEALLSYLNSPFVLHEDKIEKLSYSKLPKRELLGLWDEEKEINGKTYLPLRPVMDNEIEYLKQIEEKLKANPKIIVGLNNIGQIYWAQRHPEIRVFFDVYIYISNFISSSFYSSLLSNVEGAYFFMEDDKTNKSFTSWSFEPTDASDFNPPLFISKACFAHSCLNRSCKICKGSEFDLIQNNHKYKVSTKGCLTVVQKKE